MMIEQNIQDSETDEWLLLQCIPVKLLSVDPDLDSHDKLSTLKGVFRIRVAARNLAGLGSTAELDVTVHGGILILHNSNM